MPTRGDWLEARKLLLEGGDPRSSPHFPRFYEIVRQDGQKVLGRFRDSLDESRRQDLVQDVLVRILDELLDTERTSNPRGLFVVALKRTAISWLRSPRAAVRDYDLPAADAAAMAGAATPDDDRHFVLDARRAFDAQPERIQRILAAVALGEDREEIARAEGTSRQNIDQIVSRFRRQHRGKT